MTTSAVAVIVLLNGLQIGLPAPAFVDDGRTWFPARAVLTAAGIQVTHQPDHDRVIIGEDARLIINLPDLTVRSPTEAPQISPTSARRGDGRLYLPASVLRELGLHIGWDNASKTLSITSKTAGDPTLAISAILDAPLRYLGTRLTTTGEHIGQCPGSVIPPGDRVFWRLQGPSKNIPYTHSDRAGLQTAPLKEGRRIAVTGRLRMARNSFVYLVADRVSMLQGSGALSVSVSAARRAYNPGETMLLISRAENLLDKTIATENPPSLVITDPRNRKVHTCPLAVPSPLRPGERWRAEKTWTIPRQAIEGRYRIHLEHDTMWAHETYFEVGGEK